MKTRSSKPRKSKDASTPATSMTAMRLRVDPGKEQAGRIAQWLYIRHRFRNHAVSFLSNRRRARGKWIQAHPVLFRADGVDESLAGNDADACSRWLTERFPVGAESVPGIEQLHPQLARFISRGGMTAFQRETVRESHQVQKGLGFAVPGKRGKSGQPIYLSGTGERVVRE